MIRSRACLVLALLVSSVPAFGMLASAVPALASDARPALGVVELFTSQGCSSCPPADRTFMGIVEKDGIIAVSYHVDYWNYRGWEDTLSSPRYSERQYGYAASLGHAHVFTPQVVVNGRLSVPAADEAAITGAIGTLAEKGEGLSVPVTAALSAEELTVTVGASAAQAGDMSADIVIAYIRERARVPIERGENAGETIDYAHVVVDLATVGMWKGEAMTIRLPADLIVSNGHDGCAIFLQRRDEKGNPAAILGAALIDDYPKK